MWQSFVTGFAKQATVDIEERNKEIKKTIQQSLINRDKENEEIKKKAEKEYSSRAEVARKAASLLSNAGMPKDKMEDYIVAFVENPDRFKTFEEAVVEGRVGADSVGDFVVLPKVQTEQRATLDQVMQGFKARPKTGPAPDYSQTRSAFDLPAGRIAKAAETEAAVALGMPESEMRGLEYTAPTPRSGAQFNFNVLKSPETTEKISAKLRDKIANGEDLDTPDNKKLLNQLAASIQIKKMLEGDEDKPRTAAQIRQVFQDSIRVGVDPFVIKGVVRYDERAQDYVPIVGDADSVKQFMDHKNKVIQTQAQAMGILDKSNKIVGGRNAEDALLPYAEIKDGKVVSWKTGATEAAPAAGATAPTGTAPKSGASNVEKEKSMAYAAIAAAGGNETAIANIRRVFKQKTGQDLP